MNISDSRGSLFDKKCQDCPRLAAHLSSVRAELPAYYSAPVPGFGSDKIKLLVVGLAPGKHGANRTGRPFTGDHAGILLYSTLHKFGFANHSGSSEASDGLQLFHCRVTNAVKCLPPENKPLPVEVKSCNHYLRNEILKYLPPVVLALGRVAHEAVLLALGKKPAACRFAHGAEHEINYEEHSLVLLDSYHCSRYNTQTRRLTTEMFERVVSTAKQRTGM